MKAHEAITIISWALAAFVVVMYPPGSSLVDGTATGAFAVGIASFVIGEWRSERASRRQARGSNHRNSGDISDLFQLLIPKTLPGNVVAMTIWGVIASYMLQLDIRNGFALLDVLFITGTGFISVCNGAILFAYLYHLVRESLKPEKARVSWELTEEDAEE